MAMLAWCAAKLSMLSFSGTAVLPASLVMMSDCETSGNVNSMLRDAAAPKQALTSSSSRR